MRTKAQLHAYVQLQVACSRVAYTQREFQIAGARLACVSWVATREDADVSDQTILYFTRRRDITQDRYMAARERLHTILVVIAVLFEVDRRIQTQCLKLIYYPHASTYAFAGDEDADTWFEVTCRRIDEEIQEGIVPEVDELNRLVHELNRKLGL